MRLTNRWNRFIYRLWSPFYDLLIRLRFFRSRRKRAINSLELRAGERILLVGVGTGEDLQFLPPKVDAVGIDISSAMLARAERKKRSFSYCNIELIEADAEQLAFEDNSFDAATLILILSVVPHPAKCFQETMRVLRPGGRAVIFDKFLPDEKSKPGPLRKLTNLLTSFFGTDINRRFCDISASAEFELIDQKCDPPNQAYRVLLLSKPVDS